MGGHLPQTTILSIYPAIPASLTARESLSSVGLAQEFVPLYIQL